ncbi:MAG: EAL domain-containing protein [Xanthomonadales bacterium]|nr:EAL domain-containing protein [Xanthomonadales bacterium]
MVQLFLTNTAAAIGYFLTGLLGLQLAVGFLEASLIWPAAGLALALVYLFEFRRVGIGLFLGMLAISLYQRPGFSAATELGLASAGLLQAIVGSSLLRWRLGSVTPLIGGREIANFLVWGALCGSLISPTLGTALLAASSVLPTGELPITWMTWWLGDATGIAVFAPIVFAMASPDRSNWRHRRRTVGLPVLVLVGLVSLLQWYANQQELRRLEVLFQRQALQLENEMVRALDLAEDISVVLKSLFDSLGTPKPEVFGRFAQPLLQRHPSVQALEWIPRITHEQRLARDDALPPVREPDSQRQMVPAAVRAVYFPITYVEPLAGNERALGFDVSTNPVVQRALDEGTRTGKTVASAPIHLIQDELSQWGFVLYTPVFEEQTPSPTENALLGFVAAVFKVPSLIDTVLSRPERQMIAIRISDDGQRIFESPGRIEPHWMGTVPLTTAVSLANRTWQLEFFPKQRFLDEHFRWDTWWIYALGFVFTGLITAVLLYITGRNLVIEQVVGRRTAELQEEVSRRAAVIRQRDAHNDILRRVSDPEIPLRDLLNQIVESAAWINSEVGYSISLLDEEEDTLRLAASHGLPGGLQSELASVPVAQGYGSSSHVILANKRIRCHDVAQDPEWSNLRAAVGNSALTACWSEPIVNGAGQLLGTFDMYFFGKPRDIAALMGLQEDFSKLVSLAVERRVAQTRIRRLAYFDSLTGLPNRQRLLDRMESEIQWCRRQGRFSAVMFIDIDDLKDVNDSLGHHQGDELIRQISRRLTSVCRENEIAARLGGDEFVLLLGSRVADMGDLELQVEAVFDRIQQCLSEPIELDGYRHFVTVSVGAALLPQEGLDASDVLQQADTAMYRTKREGKNALCFYHADMKTAAQLHFDVEKGLEDALHNDRLELHYQLQFDAQRKPVAAEALLRWRHPERGLIPAGQFIEIAERSSLVVRLDAWVLREACRRIASFPDLEYLAVNVSPRHLQRPDFVDSVLAAVEEAGIRKDQLALEITEHSLIENLASTRPKLVTLMEAGIRISIDDFGTGYSSLFYLKNLPLNQIKIDKAFIAGILSNETDAFIVASVIRLAEKMNLQLVAEGVETEAQLEFLIDQHCARFQGHLLGQAMNAKALGAAMARTADTV